MRAAHFPRYSRDRELVVPFAERRDTGSPATRFPDQWKRLFLSEVEHTRYERSLWSNWRRWLHRVWEMAA
jgi:hypothetical protein